jgi:hypothetical protein
MCSSYFVQRQGVWREKGESRVNHRTQVNIFGIILAALAAWDASQLIYHQLYLWIVNGQVSDKRADRIGETVLIGIVFQ